MNEKVCVCVHCKKEFNPNPRVKRQEYCRKKECQRARRTRWMREKIKNDLDYRDNKKRCQTEWQKQNRQYWIEYRDKHPKYVKRNRSLQLLRNARNRKGRINKVIAKIDSLTRPFYARGGGLFKLVVQGRNVIAKKDSFTAKIISCNMIQVGT